MTLMYFTNKTVSYFIQLQNSERAPKSRTERVCTDSSGAIDIEVKVSAQMITV